MPDFFELLGLPRSFDIDMKKLNQNYFKLQQQFHPDRTKDNGQKSAEVNEAYNTLKNPLKRAEYIAGNNLQASPALLMEIMELREEGNLAEAQSQLDDLYKEFTKAEHSKQKEIFVKIKYLRKMIDDLSE